MRMLDAAMVGITRSSAQLEGAAGRIARGAAAPAGDATVVEDIVSMSTARADNAASLAVARVASETEGRLVDLFG